MNRSEQIDIIKKTLELEIFIRDTESELDRERILIFRSKPKEPVLKKVERSYPEIEFKLKFWKIIVAYYAIGIILTFLLLQTELYSLADIPGFMVAGGFVILPLLYFFVFKKIRQAKIDNIRKSQEYTSKCRELDEKWDNEDAELLKIYTEEKARYDTEILPKYEAEKEKWNNEQKQKISKLEKDLDENKKMLENTYREHQVVPMKYHEIEALSFLHEYLSSSQFEIKEAIEAYEKHVASIKEQEHRIQMEKMAEEQTAAAVAQADAAWEQAEIAEKARRDQNAANIAAFAQRHNTNKKLDEFLRR